MPAAKRAASSADTSTAPKKKSKSNDGELNSGLKDLASKSSKKVKCETEPTRRSTRVVPNTQPQRVGPTSVSPRTRSKTDSKPKLKNGTLKIVAVKSKTTAASKSASSKALKSTAAPKKAASANRKKASRSAKASGSIKVQVNAKVDDDDSDSVSEDCSDNEDPDGVSYWLMKAEPESRFEKGVDVKFSIDDLAAAKEPEPWDGMGFFILL